MGYWKVGSNCVVAFRSDAKERVSGMPVSLNVLNIGRSTAGNTQRIISMKAGGWGQCVFGIAFQSRGR